MTVNPEPSAPPPAPRQKPHPAAFGCLGVFVLGFGALIFFGVQEARKAPDSAKVGDCVTRSGSEEIKKIACTDPKADYKIVGKVDGKTEIEVSIRSGSICEPFAGAKSAYWRGETGKKGYVLCLAPAK